MESVGIIITALVALVAGLALGFFARKFYTEGREAGARISAQRILSDAEKQAESLIREAVVEAKDEVFKLKA